MLATVAVVFLFPSFGCGGGGGGGNPPPVLRVVVSPKPAEIKAGSGSLTFSAIVENDSTGAGVTWNFVAGSGGGTFDAATRKYSPPSFFTNPSGTDALTATSVADATKSETVNIVVDPNAGNGEIIIR